MIDLILEYKRGKKELTKLKFDDEQKQKLVNEMIADMDFAIEWMRIGKRPNFQSKAIEQKSAYERRQLINMDLFPCLEIVPERTISEYRKKAVMQVLMALSERQMNCFLLHTAHMRSMDEIAFELGIKKATVQKHIELARLKIDEIAKSIAI
ncbi:sigma factor-like helix-turn-helix DNA-binding protein [Lysinibacillus sp. NPDC048646]|uniref:sigma factor-like helix-turn-helix DNA-binding protein n=1 Tax=Lysinibacillus sp. NPDC048646 TaxID=3390574 RepID=UPI003D03E4CA